MPESAGHGGLVPARSLAAEHVDGAIQAVVAALPHDPGNHGRAAHGPGEIDAVINELIAARLLATAVHDSMSARAEACRAAGATWHEIGEGMDLQPLARVLDRPLDQIAFEHLTGAVGGPAPDARHPTFDWTCPSCDSRIHDHGPAEYRTDLREPGHHPDCPRAPRNSPTWPHRPAPTT